MANQIGEEMRLLTEGRKFRLRLFGEGIFLGTLAGIVIALFRFLLGASEEALPRLYEFLKEEPVFILPWFFMLGSIGGILYWIVHTEGMTSGSGIPQVKGILMGQMEMRWLRVLIYKFIGAVLGIGAGLSLGREGPSVQLGACVGQGVGECFSRPRVEQRYLLISGAGAGLAAAFNAPLAGVVFCIEELSKTFSPQILMGAVGAAVMATTVTQVVFGAEPVFHLGTIPVLSGGAAYLIFVLLGIFVGILGLVFHKMLVFSLDGYGKMPIPLQTKIILPLFCAGIVGFFLPELLGGGSLLVDSLVLKEYALPMLVILLVGKFIFTMLCFGSGVPGGIFLPMLVLGSLGGAVFAKLAIFCGMPMEWSTPCIVFGMVAYFSSVVKSPVTGSILIMEMTGSFDHMFALVIVSMTAYLVADMMGTVPVYDMLLGRNLAAHERMKKHGIRRSLAEIVVSDRMDGTPIKKLSLPGNALIVNVRRVEEDINPTGELVLLKGDVLFVLVDDAGLADLQQRMGEG